MDSGPAGSCGCGRLGPNVVIKGYREGAVRLWDTRSRVESTELRIQHTITVNHMRSIDKERRSSSTPANLKMRNLSGIIRRLVMELT